jgi:hypothetical protein
MRTELACVERAELAEIFEAFDVTATYDKPNCRLQLAATVTPELVPEHEKKDRPGGRAGAEFRHSGAGSRRNSATGYRITTTRNLA